MQNLNFISTKVRGSNYQKFLKQVVYSQILKTKTMFFFNSYFTSCFKRNDLTLKKFQNHHLNVMQELFNLIEDFPVKRHSVENFE